MLKDTIAPHPNYVTLVAQKLAELFYKQLDPTGRREWIFGGKPAEGLVMSPYDVIVEVRVKIARKGSDQRG